MHENALMILFMHRMKTHAITLGYSGGYNLAGYFIKVMLYWGQATAIHTEVAQCIQYQKRGLRKFAKFAIV